MKEFTAEMRNTLTEAHNKVKGTPEYYKFEMSCESKNERGRWFFLGYYIPHTTGIIKTFKGNSYILTHSNLQRYLVTDEVKALLNI